MENDRSLKGLYRQLMLAGLCLFALSLCGCVSDNNRRAEFSHVAARAKLDKGVATYHEIEVTEPMDALAPRIWIKLPDGRILDRKWFGYSTLKQAGFAGSDE